ncbi:MAG: TonB-dependent receptor [Bacteroidales bacterium]|nr:TonB-dependent receptor [Bacteroidales bacterium]
MKISFTLLFCIFLQLQATNSVAQRTRISMNATNATIGTVLNNIERNSEYVFLYSDKTVNTNRIVSLKTRSKDIRKILDELFEGSNISYKIVNKQIILKSVQHNAVVRVRENVQQQADFIVKGTVRDEKGEPLIGVSIKGTTATGAISDIDGNFSLKVREGEKLTFSYVGYTTKTVAIAGNKNLNIVLSENTKQLNEIVVTALGIKKEAKSLSYNVQQLGNDAVMKVQDVNFVNSLNGKIAGVTINSSASGVGGSSRVVMRGAKSINGNNNVLYVIDGIPMPNLQSDQPGDVFAGAGQTGDASSNINPDDIETISVLSGPSAAALYGSSAANGVILITTKKGKAERLSVNFTSSTQFSRPFVMPKFQNTYGQSESGSYYSWGDKLSTPSSYSPRDFFQTGANFTNSVSLSTGNEKNQTYVSLGSTNAQGIIHNNDYDRYNFSVRNTTSFLNDKLTMDLSYMLSNVKEQNMISQGLYFNPLVPVYLFPAGDDWNKVTFYQRYDADRNFPIQYWPYGDQGLSMQNPYWITEHDKFINHKERHMATMSLKWNITNWMNINGRVKFDKSTDRYEKKFDASTNTLFASKYGHYMLRHLENRQLYAEAFVNINKYFFHDKWSLTANIGTSFDQRDNDDDAIDGNLKGVANLFTLSNVATADPKTKYSQSGYTSRLQAIYGSAQIGYKGMAYLDVTARNDWSSKLNNSYFYSSVGLSGIFTEILPQLKSDIMPYFKARLSYSEVGNDPDQLFLTHPTYKMGPTYPETTTRMPNPDLKPERTKAWEAGLDFVFFNNKLKLNTTFYKSRTYNQFFEPALPASSGYTSVIVNSGRVDNKGLELTARFNQNLGPVNWESYLTWTLNRNKIVELLPAWKNPEDGNIYSLTQLDMGGTGGYKMRLVEGGTLSDIYVNTLRTDEHGAVYVDPVSQKVVAQPNEYIKAGSAAPKYNLGWGNNFSWKGMTLGFLFTYRVGGIVVSETQAVMDAFGVSKASADARNNGGAIVNGRPIPAQNYYQTVGSTSGNIDSRYVYSATNLRLSELTLGYNIPINRWVNFIRTANVSFVAHNLWMIYNHAPFDPELTASTGTYFQGIDYFMQPSLRNIGFSVKLQF